MTTLLFQLMSLILILFLLGVPVVVTVLLLKHLGNKRSTPDSIEFLVNKINELEERVKELEEKLDFTDID